MNCEFCGAEGECQDQCADSGMHEGPIMRKINTPTDKPSIDDCLFHRCKDHYAVAQINSNEHSGSECGACIEAYYESILHMNVSRLGGEVEGVGVMDYADLEHLLNVFRNRAERTILCRLELSQSYDKDRAAAMSAWELAQVEERIARRAVVAFFIEKLVE